ncbi:MAG: hypothetical protein ABIJ10_04575 [Candidatus Micrarchaeota archaeon]|nr:hypothetical protein [Candidatus Micrarchaeota archaeon]MBU1886760.1 hypothetical protein [Candidatus Micrarchaeota archaeon]
MNTTIQISVNLKHTLEKLKLYERETYGDIIGRLVEDELELNEQTKKEIALAREQIKKGKFTTHEKLKQELGL